MPRRAQLRPDRPEPTMAEEASVGLPEAPDAPPAEGDDLADAIMRRLEERGVPSGAWLVDISQVRTALREADALLRRLEEAIVRTAGEPRRDER